MSDSTILPHDVVEGLAPQTRLVFDVLANGRIVTGLIAMTTLGVTSLTSRVAELRKLGMDIRDEWGVDHNERRYKKYWSHVARSNQ